MQFEKTKKFNNQPVRFRLENGKVSVNAMDLLNADGKNTLGVKDTSLSFVVSDFLRENGYSEKHCSYEDFYNNGLEIWMDEYIAIKFTNKFSQKLSQWCRTKTQELSQLATDTALRLKNEYILNPSDFSLAFDYDDNPGGFMQTFTYDSQPITICLVDGGVMVNVIEMMNIFKKGCYEWYRKESTTRLAIACGQRNTSSLMTVQPNHPEDNVTGVWLNIALAEDLATWYEDTNRLRFWLQNRVEEMKFFESIASKEIYMKAYRSPKFISNNCKIGRV